MTRVEITQSVHGGLKSEDKEGMSQTPDREMPDPDSEFSPPSLIGDVQGRYRIQISGMLDLHDN
jgi:hypothetical protein